MAGACSGVDAEFRVEVGHEVGEELPAYTKRTFGLFDERWCPKVVAEVNDSYVKLARFEGEFDWHRHEGEDELIFVVEGALAVQFRDGDVELGPGEFVVVPKGAEHCPRAEGEALVMLFEPKSTLNTGDVVNERTVERLERL